MRNAALPRDHVVVRRGLRVTTPGRTVIDCLRELTLPDAGLRFVGTAATAGRQDGGADPRRPYAAYWKGIVTR
jgi:hypothetical protein